MKYKEIDMKSILRNRKERKEIYWMKSIRNQEIQKIV